MVEVAQGVAGEGGGKALCGGLGAGAGGGEGVAAAGADAQAGAIADGEFAGVGEDAGFAGGEGFAIESDGGVGLRSVRCRWPWLRARRWLGRLRFRVSGGG